MTSTGVLQKCEEQVVETQSICGVKNPTVELDWLKEKVAIFEKSLIPSAVKIYGVAYQDKSFILIKISNATTTYDCSGNIVCEAGIVNSSHKACDQGLLATIASDRLLWDNSKK
ncbi:MAG: hypothetical protein AAFX87_01665 [Bacteroidota bacterium]